MGEDMIINISMPLQRLLLLWQVLPLEFPSFLWIVLHMVERALSYQFRIILPPIYSLVTYYIGKSFQKSGGKSEFPTVAIVLWFFATVLE